MEDSDVTVDDPEAGSSSTSVPDELDESELVEVVVELEGKTVED